MILRALGTGTGRATYSTYIGTDAAYVLDATGKKAGAAIVIPQGLTSVAIAKLGWRQGTVTGTAPSYAASLYAIDTSTGNPTGAALASCSSHVPAAGNNTTNRSDSLPDTYTVTPGTTYAVVMEYVTGTVNGSNNCSFFASTSGNTSQAPYGWTYDGSSWTKKAGPNFFFLVTAAGECIGTPKVASASQSVRNATTYQVESGGVLVTPAGWGSFKIAGVHITASTATTASNTLEMRLYDSGGTLLQTATIDTDVTIASAGGNLCFVFPGTLATLTGGSTYRLVLYSSLTSASFSFNSYSVTDAAYQLYPFNQSWYKTEKPHGSGSFTDSTTVAPDWFLDIIPVTSGGLLINPGLSGGLR